MSTKHTPGPWHTGRNTVVRNTIVYDQSGNAICDCKTFHGKHRESEGSANATLIAAAPQLLEALKLCHEQLSLYVADDKQSPEDNEALTKAMGAIALTE
jgi:hypothetical protein